MLIRIIGFIKYFIIRDAKISQSKILPCTIKRKIQHEKKLRTNIIVLLIKLNFQLINSEFEKLFASV